MERVIYCNEGIAYICLCNENMDVLICGSLVNSSYWNLPFKYVMININDDIIFCGEDKHFNINTLIYILFN